MLIADSPQAFADSVARVLRDATLRARLERRAVAAARALPSWDDAADAVASVYERLAAGASRGEVLSVAGRSG
jgi:glycosyltransferase involved in cell wall biosynthesis